MAEKQKKSPPVATPGGFYETLRQRQNRNLLKNAFLAVILLLMCAWGSRIIDTNVPADGEIGVQQSTQSSTLGSSAQTTLTTQTTENSYGTEATEGTTVTAGTENTQVTEQTETTEATQVPEKTEATQAPEETENTQATENSETTEATQAPPETVPPMQIAITQFSSEVSLIPEVARAFSVRDMSVPVQTAIFQYKKPGVRLDVGLSVKLAVHVEHITEGLTVTSIMMEVADNDRFENPWVFRQAGSEQSVELQHLKVDSTYYYRASVTFSDQTVQTVESSFQTAATPRLLSIEGIVNVRDIGGWKTVDGKTIRQGLLYRGSELDAAASRDGYKLTDKGLRDMLDVLQIRTDMDLRSTYENPDNIHALGEGIEHIHYDASGYADAFGDYGCQAVQKIFSDLADQSKYPVYLHCTYGADRTGTICYLLEALLGLSEEDLLREYELSALYYSWAESQKMDKFIAGLKQFQGETMQEKVANFLVSTGVTEAQIESIRSIFLEDA